MKRRIGDSDGEIGAESAELRLDCSKKDGVNEFSLMLAAGRDSELDELAHYHLVKASKKISKIF